MHLREKEKLKCHCERKIHTRRVCIAHMLRERDNELGRGIGRGRMHKHQPLAD